MNNELKTIEKRIAQISLRIDALWWKCVWLMATPEDYAEIKSLQAQVNEELKKRDILAENLRHEQAILRENGR